MVLNDMAYTIISATVGVILIVLAFLAISCKKIMTSVIYLSAMSLFAVIGFVLLRAPDVAITEAVIGSGLTTALFIFTLLSVKKFEQKNVREAGDSE